MALIERLQDLLIGLAETARRILLSSRSVLALLLAGALLLRLFGVGYGLPDRLVDGEEEITGRALQLLRTGEITPATFEYPPVSVHLHLLTYLLTSFGGMATGLLDATKPLDTWSNVWLYYLAGRILNALMGTASIWLLYRIARQLYGQKIAMVAALLLAVSALPVELSHFISSETPGLFFVLLAFWFICRATERRRPRDFALAGFLVGVAAGTQYRAVLLVVPLGVAAVMSYLQDRSENDVGPRVARQKLGHNLLGAALFIVAGFLVADPYIFVSLPFFLDGFGKQMVSLRPYPAYMAGWGEQMLTLAATKVGLAPALLGASGMAYALCRHRRPDALLLSFVLTHIVVELPYLARFGGYWLALLPFLCVLGTRLLVEAAERIQSAAEQDRPGWQANWLLPGLLAIALLEPAGRTLVFDYSLTQKDTRTLAREWIEAQIPRSTRIATEQDFPELPGYDTVSAWALGYEHPLTWYKDEGYALLVLSGDKAREHQAPKYARIGQFQQGLAREGTLLKEFRPAPAAPGPSVRIYQILSIIKRGDLLFADDFARQELGEWRIEAGKWTSERGMLHGLADAAVKPVRAFTGSSSGSKLPEGWTIAHAPAVAIEGGALRMYSERSNDTVFSPQVRGGTVPVKVAFEIKTEMERPNLHVQYNTFDAAHNPIKCCMSLQVVSQSADWAPRSYEIQPSNLPTNTAYLNVEFKWYGQGDAQPKGTAWVRDFTLGSLSAGNLILADVPGVALWDDYEYETHLMLGGKASTAGLAFRVKDSLNFYLLELDAGSQVVRLSRVENGEAWPLAEQQARIETARFYQVKIAAGGQEFNAFLDDQQVLRAVDANLAKGGVGFLLGEGAEAYFSDVKVQYEP